jgi:hypothetical protein
MSRVLTAPSYDSFVPPGYKSLFLAGGITNCPNWQATAIEKLKDFKVIIFNPRRDNFPIEDQQAAEQQIKWEFDYLAKADMVLFWFAKGSDNPIVLFEYGRHGINPERPVYVGTDLGYSRRRDVIIQTKLAHKQYHIHGDLNELLNSVKVALERLPRFIPGQQLVHIHRFKNGNQGQLEKEGEIMLKVEKAEMLLSTFRMCCSDYLNACTVLTTGFLGKTFLVAYERSDGVMIPSKGDSELRITLASDDPQWCRNCGAKITLPGTFSCSSCLHGVNGAV